MQNHPKNAPKPDYASIGLTSDPCESVAAWMQEAVDKKAPEPTAMALATSTPQGLPSVRIVLFKNWSQVSDGRKAPRFFTNYDGRKSAELTANPHAAVVLFWPTLNRQIRIEGKIEKLSATESNEYYQSRPRGSRLGAWASPQSRTINSRQELLDLVKNVEARFGVREEDGVVPLPPNWGGWRLVPERMEFWQAGEYRLHDRFEYRWYDGTWVISRLAP